MSDLVHIGDVWVRPFEVLAVGPGPDSGKVTLYLTNGHAVRARLDRGMDIASVANLLEREEP